MEKFILAVIVGMGLSLSAHAELKQVKQVMECHFYGKKPNFTVAKDATPINEGIIGITIDGTAEEQFFAKTKYTPNTEQELKARALCRQAGGIPEPRLWNTSKDYVEAYTNQAPLISLEDGRDAITEIYYNMEDKNKS